MESKNQTSGVLIIIIVIIVVLVIGLGVMSLAFFRASRLKVNREFGMFDTMNYRGSGLMVEGRNFGGGRIGFGRLSGQVTAISGSNLTVKDAAGDSISVVISDTTSVYNQGKIAKASDIKVNNSVIVLGQPNSSGVVPATAILIQ
ncbi:MAG: hypothetical protein ABSE91_01455 [Patescibacteria group bacterium]|jgi:hypothetical protein